MEKENKKVHVTCIDLAKDKVSYKWAVLQNSTISGFQYFLNSIYP